MDLNLLISDRPEDENAMIKENKKPQKKQKQVQKAFKTSKSSNSNTSNFEETKSEIQNKLGIKDFQWKMESEQIVKDILEKYRRITEIKYPHCKNDHCLNLQSENIELKNLLFKLNGALKIAKIELSKAYDGPPTKFHEEKECQTRQYILKERIEVLKTEIDSLKSEKYHRQESHRKEIQRLKSFIDELKCFRTQKSTMEPKIQENKLVEANEIITRLRIELSNEKSKVNSKEQKINNLEKDLIQVKNKLYSMTSLATQEELKSLRKENERMNTKIEQLYLDRQIEKKFPYSHKIINIVLEHIENFEGNQFRMISSKFLDLMNYCGSIIKTFFASIHRLCKKFGNLKIISPTQAVYTLLSSSSDKIPNFTKIAISRLATESLIFQRNFYILMRNNEQLELKIKELEYQNFYLFEYLSMGKDNLVSSLCSASSFQLRNTAISTLGVKSKQRDESLRVLKNFVELIEKWGYLDSRLE